MMLFLHFRVIWVPTFPRRKQVNKSVNPEVNRKCVHNKPYPGMLQLNRLPVVNPILVTFIGPKTSTPHSNLNESSSYLIQLQYLH